MRSIKYNQKFTGWVCGGSIVHPQYILTSAACLRDVEHVYAISGYSKYVRSEDIDRDNCTKRIKKKVVSRAYQKGLLILPLATVLLELVQPFLRN